MKTVQIACMLIGFGFLATVYSVQSLRVRSNECQSTIIKLQDRITDLERLLWECDSRFRAHPRSHMEGRMQRFQGSERRSRQLLQSSDEDGLAKVPANDSQGVASDAQTTGGEAVVRLGLLLALTGVVAGKYVVGAATLAIADINTDPSLMQGRKIEYIYADSGCSSLTGVTGMEELLQTDKPINAVIGTTCSSACESVAFLTAARGLPQVSDRLGSGELVVGLTYSCRTHARAHLCSDIRIHHDDRSRLAALRICCRQERGGVSIHYG